MKIKKLLVEDEIKTDKKNIKSITTKDADGEELTYDKSSWTDIIDLLKSGNKDYNENGKQLAITLFASLHKRAHQPFANNILKKFKPKFILEFMESLTEADARNANDRVLRGFDLISLLKNNEILTDLSDNEKLFRDIYNTFLDVIDVNKIDADSYELLKNNPSVNILQNDKFYSISTSDRRRLFDYILTILNNSDNDEKYKISSLKKLNNDLSKMTYKGYIATRAEDEENSANSDFRINRLLSNAVSLYGKEAIINAIKNIK